MAKGGLLSTLSGKLGNSVAYRLRNSNNKETQGWRVYQPRVGNPQTDAQARQRLKLAAVNNIYRALKSVIVRGFENKSYGEASRRAWLSMALGSDFTGPYLPKGSTNAVPITAVPLTYGTLTPVNYFYRDGATQLDVQGAVIAENAILNPSIAQVSQCLIGKGYAEGDQVTFIWCDGGFIWHTVSFYLDTNNQEKFGALFFSDPNTDLSEFRITSAGVIQTPLTPAGAAVAVSRDGAGSLNLRSTAFPIILPWVAEWYYSNSALLQAVASYQSTPASNDDWQLSRQLDSAGAADSPARTISGTEVVITSLRQDGDYLKAVATDGTSYFISSSDIGSILYRRYLTSKTTKTDTGDTPEGATDANTVTVGSTASGSQPVDRAFAVWLLANGVSYDVLFFA